ncbi:MBL fold metallo-hydrolase [Antrihabitans cavernicola]|uniref:MBL fold metallo-hydrolase n=1 Tax=Antrihabitans cavernicola TaxID=2495913 RepID=A0A5A7SB24_9NOCA|nr:MBL fold metallo-hydrolase [Spelaeibacter cavernicola]KAA0022724.1 MBL fold metallo-hydrolase [Spelaeibacter cavernicola]
MSDALAIGDGIFQITVPMSHNPLGSTLVYAMESPGGIVLVDAGWDADEGWEGLTSGLASVGHSISEVEGVVLSHFHPDHTGLCGRVRDASGAWIAMHEDDHEWFRHMVMPRDAAWIAEQVENLGNAGAPQDALDAFAALELDAPVGPESAPDRTLAEGETIELAGRALRVAFTPGHTPGHACFYLEDADVMFTGDHVLQKTTPHVGNFTYPLEERDALAEFLASLDRVQSMGITRGLGAHGLPMPDLPGRAKELIEHHEERLDHLYDAFGDDEITVWQVAERMKWYRPWSAFAPLARSMALSEAAAHLRHLVARGRVAQVPGTEPARFARR